MGDFVDLCAGPHLPNLNYLKAFKLTQIAGAYWRGDENKKMLSRIYGTCFPTKPELKEYLAMVEEARKRDHNKLGRELELFTTADIIGQGLPIFLPKGTRIIMQITAALGGGHRDEPNAATCTPKPRCLPNAICIQGLRPLGSLSATACLSWATRTTKPRNASHSGP